MFNVAASDFNMGAMENKGLNVFNTKYVLADPETTTDNEYRRIEGVIAHEYFHNWSGNRVTCRDWFQLSLKEGLTVFREQQFSRRQAIGRGETHHEVPALRGVQFPEDAGPLAHPVRGPLHGDRQFLHCDGVQKGRRGDPHDGGHHRAQGFRRGMDLYFPRHDKQAVTIEDFVQAMADASGVDLTDFKLWYHQAESRY